MKALIVFLVTATSLVADIDWNKKIGTLECHGLSLEDAVYSALESAGEDPKELVLEFQPPGITIRYVDCVSELDEESLAVVEALSSEYLAKQLGELSKKTKKLSAPTPIPMLRNQSLHRAIGFLAQSVGYRPTFAGVRLTLVSDETIYVGAFKYETSLDDHTLIHLNVHYDRASHVFFDSHGYRRTVDGRIADARAKLPVLEKLHEEGVTDEQLHKLLRYLNAWSCLGSKGPPSAEIAPLYNRYKELIKEAQPVATGQRR